MEVEAESQPVKVLTVGGSDSGGAAGIQADLKTWTALAAYGMSVITTVTAQNSLEVTAVQFISPELVKSQIAAIFDDYGAEAVKTGLIGDTDLIKVISTMLFDHEPNHIIIDPVLVNHRQQAMFSPHVVEAYRSLLLPLADLVTPNWTEALLLSGSSAAEAPDHDTIPRVIDQLHVLGARHVLITGMRQGSSVADIYSNNERQLLLPMPWIETDNTHGSGDTLSAAICAKLAQGLSMLEAIQQAQTFTAAALRAARDWRMGKGHGPLSHFH
ncbi:MAG: bifunctional hydroxymethylpyrimidine kinase/phosphomethylpyrimidine kinase [Candidatus Promineifilaceae bacterium]|nr:bifunctional hydroxymethylpyrimidine kinase/phosphomethylpyrimidine kinase [Candidatus Promineifilaceae bacterium]